MDLVFCFVFFFLLSDWFFIMGFNFKYASSRKLWAQVSVRIETEVEFRNMVSGVGVTG